MTVAFKGIQVGCAAGEKVESPSTPIQEEFSCNETLYYFFLWCLSSLKR